MRHMSLNQQRIIHFAVGKAMRFVSYGQHFLCVRQVRAIK